MTHRTTHPRRKKPISIEATSVHVSKLSEDMKRIRSSRRDSPGFCVDIDAPKSCIGLRGHKSIFSRFGRRVPQMKWSPNRFRIADTSYNSLGKVSLPRATPPSGPPIVVEMDVVNADIPALLGLDVRDREALMADTVANRLTRRSFVQNNGSFLYLDEWHVPLLRSESGHVYVEMDFPSSGMLTRSQLGKLHKQFFHPFAEKLFNLLKKARPEETTAGTVSILQDLSKRRDPCQRIHTAPTRFRVSFGAENARFNERVLLDIVTIDGKPVLHNVDEGTRFSAARFVPDVSTNTIWSTILDCWAMIYTGLPNRMLVDKGTNFGGAFKTLGALANISVDSTRVEAHSSLGLGEWYHQPLRQKFRKIMAAHPKTPPARALAASVKAMNDTLGPEGLVPSALVFREFPPVFTKSEAPAARLILGERASVAQSARKEMGKLMGVRRALHHRTLSAADRFYQPGDQVLVWREKIVNHRIGEWLGPFTVLCTDESRKLVYVQDAKIGAARRFKAVQVKRYLTSETTSVNLAHFFMMDLGGALGRFGTTSVEAQTTTGVHLTEIITRGDPRAYSPEMNAAKKAEIKNLLERGTFKVILKEELPPDGNVLPGRFVLAIKSTDDGKINYKARYVIGGHRDKYKAFMVHSTSTMQPQSIRLLLALAAVFEFDIWTSDVRQAYLQSAEPLARDIFTRSPVQEFELNRS